MFGDQPLNFTLVAAVDTPRYTIVQGSGTNYGGYAVSKTNTLLGIAQNEPKAGEHLGVCPIGISRIAVGSAVALGNRLTAGASGQAIAAGSGDSFVAVALEAGSPGDLIRCWVVGPGNNVIA